MSDRNGLKVDLLSNAISKISGFCNDSGIECVASNEESDFQSIFIASKNPRIIDEIFDEFYQAFDDVGILLDTKKVRGGTIFTVSLLSLSEQEWDEILSAYNEEIEMADRLIDGRPDFLTTARKIYESQYKSATSGATRANQSSRQRASLTTNISYGGVKHPNSKAKSFGDEISVMEDLNGLATANDAQPLDLFRKFGKALKVLGTSLGIGPIQDKLKERGIGWKLSKDRQSIVMYVINATTKAPQALMRIPAETLDEPHELEAHLLNMLDFAKGEAPGALKQKQQAIQAQEKVVRDIVNALKPKEDDAENPIKSMLGS